MTIKVLNVNDTIDLIIGGGTAERTFQMSRFLTLQGMLCKVLTIDSEHLTEQRLNALKPAEIEVLPSTWKRFSFPKIKWRLIQKLVGEADIIHLMGHWSVLNMLVYFAARQANKPYVVCPAGALPIFGRSSILKRFYNLFIGKAIIRNASAWIAVTNAEFSDFNAYGIPSSQVTVIPNGVSEVNFPVVDAKQFLDSYELTNKKIILFMGRLNLIKGPDLLLQAYIKEYSDLSDFHLVFAGPDGGMQSELKKLIAHTEIAKQVHFLGHVSGANKSVIYRSACLLVVPSRQEAMSIVAIEAGICGTPILITDKCGFSEINKLNINAEVSATVDSIAVGMKYLLHDLDRLHHAGVALKKHVVRYYTWNTIVSYYLKLYQSMISK